MKRTLAAAVAAFAILVTSTVVSAQTRGRVLINDQPINAQQLGVLEYSYGPIQSGAYWYDPISGLWGMQGGPASGQIAAWLSLGGPLRSDASGGGTGVYINGRELHPVDVQRLRQIYGTVVKGRYWMTSDGIGGFEGGPAIFNLGAATGGGGGGGGGGGYDRGAFGTWGSNGTCWYVSVEGGDVMGPGC